MVVVRTLHCECGLLTSDWEQIGDNLICPVCHRIVAEIGDNAHKDPGEKEEKVIYKDVEINLKKVHDGFLFFSDKYVWEVEFEPENPFADPLNHPQKKADALEEAKRFIDTYYTNLEKKGD